MVEEVNSVYMLPPVCIPQSQQQSHPSHMTDCNDFLNLSTCKWTQSQKMKHKSKCILQVINNPVIHH